MRDLVVTTLQQARRLIVIVVGFTVLLIGLAMAWPWSSRCSSALGSPRPVCSCPVG